MSNIINKVDMLFCSHTKDKQGQRTQPCFKHHLLTQNYSVFYALRIMNPEEGVDEY